MLGCGYLFFVWFNCPPRFNRGGRIREDGLGALTSYCLRWRCRRMRCYFRPASPAGSLHSAAPRTKTTTHSGVEREAASCALTKKMGARVTRWQWKSVTSPNSRAIQCILYLGLGIRGFASILYMLLGRGSAGLFFWGGGEENGIVIHSVLFSRFSIKNECLR